jgi:hypothetical protein
MKLWGILGEKTINGADVAQFAKEIIALDPKEKPFNRSEKTDRTELSFTEQDKIWSQPQD